MLIHVHTVVSSHRAESRRSISSRDGCCILYCSVYRLVMMLMMVLLARSLAMCVSLAMARLICDYGSPPSPPPRIDSEDPPPPPRPLVEPPLPLAVPLRPSTTCPIPVLTAAAPVMAAAAVVPINTPAPLPPRAKGLTPLCFDETSLWANRHNTRGSPPLPVVRLMT